MRQGYTAALQCEYFLPVTSGVQHSEKAFSLADILHLRKRKDGERPIGDSCVRSQCTGHSASADGVKYGTPVVHLRRDIKCLFPREKLSLQNP